MNNKGGEIMSTMKQDILKAINRYEDITIDTLSKILSEELSYEGIYSLILNLKNIINID